MPTGREVDLRSPQTGGRRGHDPATRPVGAPPVPRQRLGQRALDHRLVLDLQRIAGNRAATVVVQRRPGPRTAKHPENFPTYEGWLGSFHGMSTFDSKDQAPSEDEPESPRRVLGDKAASRDPKAPPGERPPDPIGRQKADAFIDHPTDTWVRENLPEELRQTAYRLPADCADIAVVLRHVWLFAHRHSERYGGFVVGFLPGETDAARSKRVGKDIKGINTPQVPTMVNAYADGAGRPMRSVVALAPLLHPGDILLWAHHAGGDAPDPTRPRTGGHTQTIVSITRAGGTITKIETLQGNEPLAKATGFGSAPGRRIEARDLSTPRDLTIPAKGRTPAEQVWDFGDGHTTLVVAGPPRSGARPAAKKEHGKVVRHLTDWRPAIAAAARGALVGVFEAAMREAQTMLERGDPPAEVVGEARSLGSAARARLTVLDAQLATAKKPADPTAREDIRATLAAMRSGAGSTAAATMTTVFTAVTAAFEGTVAQPGWSGAAANDPDAGERLVGHVRRIPLEGLPAAGAPRAIVALPARITGGKAPVDVLLHFHGRDPGKQRDLGVDRVEEQLEGSGRRMLAVLPQGSKLADFGSFDADAYLTAVFAALTTTRIWSPAPPRGSVVLAGHSGGGKAATDLATGGVLSGVTELALFDGINGPAELAVIETWVGKQLDAAADRLRLPPVRGNAAKEADVLRTVVRLRAYHSGSTTARPSRKKLDYPGLHATLRATIAEWFDRRGGELSPGAATTLRSMFDVISTGQKDHNTMVGGRSRPGSTVGTLQDALGR